MPNFSDILSTPIEAIEAPKPLPVGTYTVAVKQLPSQNERGGGSYDVIEFELTVLSAQDDVDAAAIEDFGSVQGKILRRAFIFDKNDKEKQGQTLFAMKQFFDHLGIDTAGKSVAEAINETPGAQCLASVRWRQDSRPGVDRTYAEVGSTAKI